MIRQNGLDECTSFHSECIVFDDYCFFLRLKVDFVHILIKVEDKLYYCIKDTERN